MLVRICLSYICFLLTIKTAFAEIVNVNNEQIKELSKIVDVMIIIGSFTSANSKRLTQLAKQRNENSYQVVDELDLKSEWFEGVDKVGISAGASTPDNIIQSVTKHINNLSN